MGLLSLTISLQLWDPTFLRHPAAEASGRGPPAHCPLPQPGRQECPSAERTCEPSLFGRQRPGLFLGDPRGILGDIFGIDLLGVMLFWIFLVDRFG